MDYFYYWPDYELDTFGQTKARYKLHRDTPDMLEICPGDTIWCVASLGFVPKPVALAAKMIAAKSGTNDPSHPDYRAFGPYYFVAGRTGTEFYVVNGQAGLEEILRKFTSFPVRAEHVGGSFQGPNGFRKLRPSDAASLRAFAASLSSHPVIKVKPKGGRP
ncbi:MAG TPA: hypothetical protein VFE63_12440 [Roseiarcus sp.]|jgi:hypothetical protein|nr:hypothetical protein [Roseiarcus sp.]